MDFVLRHSKSAEVEAPAHHGVRRRSHASCKAVSRQKGDVQERLNNEKVAVHASKSLPRQARKHREKVAVRASKSKPRRSESVMRP